jgi:hypothetical protein
MSSTDQGGGKRRVVPNELVLADVHRARPLELITQKRVWRSGWEEDGLNDPLPGTSPALGPRKDPNPPPELLRLAVARPAITYTAGLLI